MADEKKKRQQKEKKQQLERTQARAPQEVYGQELFEERKHLLDRSVIAVPLLEEINRAPRTRRAVIIDVNLEHPGGAEAAKANVVRRIHEITRTTSAMSRARPAHAHPDQRQKAPRGPVDEVKTAALPQYVIAELTGHQIRRLVRLDRESRGRGESPAVHRVWPDFPLEAHVTRSVRTVKCDAARIAFSALGEGILWAVMDSGIAGDHPHFVEHRNLSNRRGDQKLPWAHQDFTGEDAPLSDGLGHGTHVAGIIAGEVPPVASRRLADAEDEPAAEDDTAGTTDSAATDTASATDDRPPPAVPGPLFVASRSRDESGATAIERSELPAVSGMAPKTKLLSLKVLDARGQGATSNLLAAIAYVQQLNGFGRRIVVHGVNMSLGYGFDPEWFACGQSPLCVEVDRLVRSGVVVVVAAGNTGYGFTQVKGRRDLVAAGLDLTINDPGNAALAITVGSTHRDMPHVYGVSYFSSKGPTGDGRLKPDLLAPGERIVSCAAGKPAADAAASAGGPCHYREDSGTSMAAPHVAGAIAAFLSVREEFIGRPEEVKRIFLDSATDLGRERYFQGHGVVDVMRAIQSV
jgi:serine protease AprX